MRSKASRHVHSLVGLGIALASAVGLLTACDRNNNFETASSSSASNSANSFDAPPVTTADAGRPGADANGTADAGATPAYPSVNTADRGTGLQDRSAVDPGVMAEQNPTSAGTALNDTDKAFLRDAGRAGLFEMQAAQLAIGKTNDSAVKSYASMLLEDHQAANEKLKKLAGQLHVDAPTTIASDQKQMIDGLQKATGPEFDQKFVQAAGAQAHEKVIALFEKISRDASDPALRDFAHNTLPTLKAHLTTAQKLPVKG